MKLKIFKKKSTKPHQNFTFSVVIKQCDVKVFVMIQQSSSLILKYRQQKNDAFLIRPAYAWYYYFRCPQKLHFLLFQDYLVITKFAISFKQTVSDRPKSKTKYNCFLAVLQLLSKNVCRTKISQVIFIHHFMQVFHGI